MPIRSRGGGGGDGGGVPGVGLLEWGPDFGGVGGDHLTESHALALFDLLLAGGLTQAHALNIVALAMDGGIAQAHSTAIADLGLLNETLAQAQRVDLFDAGLSGEIGQSQAVHHTLLELGGISAQAQALNIVALDLTAQTLAQAHAVLLLEAMLIGGIEQAQALNHTILQMGGVSQQAQALNIIALELVGGVQQGQRISSLEYFVQFGTPAKDCTVSSIAGCVGAPANENGSGNLRASNIVATSAEFLVGWNLTAFPTGATVIDSTFTLTTQSVGTAATDLQASLIDTADEGWSETGVVCSNRPTPVGAAAYDVFDFTTAANESQQRPSTSAARTRIAARMGVGTFSVVCQNITAVVQNRQFINRENGSFNGTRPLMSMRFTVPV